MYHFVWFCTLPTVTFLSGQEHETEQVKASAALHSFYTYDLVSAVSYDWWNSWSGTESILVSLLQSNHTQCFVESMIKQKVWFSEVLCYLHGEGMNEGYQYQSQTEHLCVWVSKNESKNQKSIAMFHLYSVLYSQWGWLKYYLQLSQS